MNEDSIQNRVTESGLLQLDLAAALTPPADVLACDLADHMESGLVLREKAYREAVRSWRAPESGAVVALFCSTDAVVPEWAWMLATSQWTALKLSVYVGDVDAVRDRLWVESVNTLDVSEFTDQRVILRGCSDVGGAAVLSALVTRLQPVVKSLMFGEACSTVPVYKRPASKA